MYKLFFKRTIDIILSGIAIILLIPVWILLAVAIKVDDPGPVFFPGEDPDPVVFRRSYGNHPANAVLASLAGGAGIGNVENVHFMASISFSAASRQS